MIDRNAWAEPGCFEVGPGIYRIPLPLPGDALRAVNVYALTDGDGVMMIDGGWALAESEALLTRSLDQLGFGLGDIREFLVTHFHRDHYSQAIAVRRLHGTPVALGAGEQANLAVIRNDQLRPNSWRLLEAGASELAHALAAQRRDPEERRAVEDPDRWLEDSIDIPMSTRALRVIATPGHTRGHVVFHDSAAATLFAGDHVLPHITPSIGFELAPGASPLRDYLDSLRLVLAMPDSQLLPAHGPVTESTHARVEELLNHHDERLAATAEAVSGGAHTGYEVAGRLGWTRRKTRLADLDQLNQMLAIRETMAHLEVLVERGWLTRHLVDDVVHFDRA